MKKVVFLSAVFASNLIFSQVSIEKNKLQKDGSLYKFSQYREVFQNKEAQVLFSKARGNKTVADVLAFSGGFALGFGIATEIRKGDRRLSDGTVIQTKENSGWGFIGIGAGLIGVGIPFVITANKQAKKAIAIENGETQAFQPYFQLTPTGNGLALGYHF